MPRHEWAAEKKQPPPKKVMGTWVLDGGALISDLSAFYPQLAFPPSLRLCFLAHSASGTHKRGLEGRGEGEVGVSLRLLLCLQGLHLLLWPQASPLDPRPRSPFLLPSGEGGSLLCWPRLPTITVHFPVTLPPMEPIPWIQFSLF